MSRPDRSDSHLSPEAEAKIEAEAREYFDGVVPKRHTKPSRSEYSAVYSDALQAAASGDQAAIPELDKFRDLENHPEKIVCDASEVAEEFVETEYYQDLNSIGKQHHTTGTGFIKMEKPNGSGFGIKPDSDPLIIHESCKGNPATNEWIPSADIVIPESHKPHRSEA